MSEYGPGLTMQEAFSLDKEQVKMALQGFIVSGENENGFTYERASQEECAMVIIDKFNNAVYQANEQRKYGLVMEKLLVDNKVKFKIMDVIKLKQEIDRQEEIYDDVYDYDDEEEDCDE